MTSSKVLRAIQLAAAHVVSGALPLTRGFAVRRRAFRQAGLGLEDGVRLCSGVRFDNSFVSVGSNTWVGSGSRFIAGPDARIVVGSNCDLGPDVLLVTGSHLIGEEGRRAGAGLSRPIEVRDGVWIGARATVLSGVTIGTGSVVAAGAVVTEDVPDNVLVGGVPARVLRTLS